MVGGIVVERLEALMRERGYGPGELAYQSGLSYNYIYKIRKGGAPNIAAAQVQKLAKALKTSPAYLLGQSSVSGVDTDYEIIEGRVELAPAIEELARQVNDLPAELRAQMVSLVQQLLELVVGLSAQAKAPASAVDLNAPAAIDDPQADRTARFARIWDNLTPAEQDELLAELVALTANERRAAANE